MTATAVARLLAEPEHATALDAAAWPAVIAAARAEQLIGALAFRLDGLPLPATVRLLLADARSAAEEGRRSALWEAEMARRVLALLGVPVVLLKGTAYVAAGLAAGRGRHVGDLDVLVPHEGLPRVEAALLAAGWGWAKPDPYDDAYYRRWMHELPPLLHPDRDRMIDVHHTILPLTARPRPDAAALFAAAETLGNGLLVLSREDMLIHAALHLFADGDLSGGLRNLWDIDRLVRDLAEDDVASRLEARAARHGAGAVVGRALRLAHAVFATPVPVAYRRLSRADRTFRRRLLARDGWGRETRPVTRFAFYVRSHWIRMPPALLARHLVVKAWRGVARGR